MYSTLKLIPCPSLNLACNSNNSNNPTSGWVCIVAGIPGAGKSTLCRRLASLLSDTVHLEGDLIVGRQCDLNGVAYKQRRRAIIDAIDGVVRNNEKHQKPQRHVNVLVDECMWLGSMRRQVERWCRDNHRAFGVIWMHVADMAMAVKWDAEREHCVGVEVIKKMGECAEAPKRDCMVVNAHACIDMDSIIVFLSRLNVPPPPLPVSSQGNGNGDSRESMKHRVNVQLCRLAGILIKDCRFDPLLVCRAKRRLLSDPSILGYQNDDNLLLRELFIEECQWLQSE